MTHGFVDTGGSFTTIDVPGASSTQGAFGINDSGQIVGWWFGAIGEHGFLATPVPEPPSALTLATCLVALFAMAGRRKRASAHQTTQSAPAEDGEELLRLPGEGD